jgi:TolB-like protein
MRYNHFVNAKISKFLLALCAVGGAGFWTHKAYGDAATTRPAAVNTVAPGVVVFPLTVIGDAGHEWMGRAMQEGIAGELQKSGGVNAIAGQSQNGAADPESIRAVAAANHVDYVIVGSIQILDMQMRVDARVVRGATDEAVGNLRGDGNVRDLFTIEDDLARQANRVLNPVPTSPANRNPVKRALARPKIQWVSPPAVYQSRYFDGDLARELAVPPQFTAETDKYNYHPTSIYFYGCGYGYPFACGYGFFGRGFGVGMYGLQTEAPTSGW